MLKYLAALILLFVVSASIAQDDFSLYLRKEYTGRNGKTMPYRLLYPKNYNPSVKYPVILFLHGSGERGDDNESQLKNGAKLFLLEENRKKYPCFVIFPQCPADGFWSSVKIDSKTTPPTYNFDYSVSETESLTSAIAILKHIMAEESVEKSRVYITGLSMGGMGTFEAVYRYPELFSVAIPMCGGGDARLYDINLKGVYFWIFHGEDDQSVPLKYSREMVERLEELKVDVKYAQYPGVKHNVWEYAFADKNFMPWMFSHKRKIKSK